MEYLFRLPGTKHLIIRKSNISSILFRKYNKHHSILPTDNSSMMIAVHSQYALYLPTDFQ